MSDLEQVVALIRAGKKVEARKQLLTILADDRENERAWVYMALCAANREELVASVRHALKVNPQSTAALKLAAQHKIAIPRPQPAQPLAKPSTSPPRKPEPQVAEVTEDPYPTQEAHPTQLLPPRPPTSKVKVDVKSEFAMPNWVGSEFKEDALKGKQKSKRRRRFIAFTLVGVFVIVAVALVAIVLLTSSDEPLGSNAQTATSISGTNAVIMDSQQQRATSIWLTLNPPTPTRPPRENAQ
ncbi:MAG: hypothetical protein F9K46_11380 [Anaerolineae bacterium]|nr:MAG: hypothetical protein F9K46_11380 [Anaerolineae bacterium]